ncbi:MAG TPA: hypothetical protein VNZ22_14340 [Bacillota bacterium]|nr:hypothetical protein [Bacillota bacterium]
MKEAVASPPSPEERADKPVPITPGVANLLRGTNGAAKPEPPSSQPSPEAPSQAPAQSQPQPVSYLQPQVAPPAAGRRHPLLRAMLVLADLLLLGLATHLVLTSHGPLGPVDTFLCVIAVGVGACLGCLAVILE